MGRREQVGHESYLGCLERSSREATLHSRAGKTGTSGHIWSPGSCPQHQGQTAQWYGGLDVLSRRVCCWTAIACGYWDSHLRYLEPFCHLSKMHHSPSLAVKLWSAFDSALAVHTACQLCHCSKDLSVQAALFIPEDNKEGCLQTASLHSILPFVAGGSCAPAIHLPVSQWPAACHDTWKPQQTTEQKSWNSSLSSTLLKTNIPLYIYQVTCPNALSRRPDNTSLSFLLLLVCYFSSKYALNILLVGDNG